MFGGGGQARYAAVPHVELQHVAPRGSLAAGAAAAAAAAAAEGDGDDEDAALDEENRHMPLTAVRLATWQSCAFHSITAMVGAGVLGLPYSFVHLGWAGGMAVMALSALISWVTFAELVHLHEEQHPLHPATKPPRRHNRYHELTARAWGVPWGHIAIVPFQVAVMVGLAVTYTVTAGDALLALAMRGGLRGVTRGGCIVAFSVLEAGLAQLPSFSHLSWVSGMGALMSLVYSSIAVLLCVTHTRGAAWDKLQLQQAPPAAGPLDATQQQEQQGQLQQGQLAGSVSYALGSAGESGREYLFAAANAVATIAFAWGGHNVALEIQSSLPCPPSSVQPMMKGVNAAYAVTCACYFGVAAAGYATFGNAVTENLLAAFDGAPAAALCIAEAAVVLHVAASYQVYSFCIFDMVQQALWRSGLRLGPAGSRLLRIGYVAATCVTAVALPFFTDLMGLVGALGVTPTTFIMPAVLWLTLRRPTSAAVWWGNAAIIVACAAVGLLGTVASLRLIVQHASEWW